MKQTEIKLDSIGFLKLKSYISAMIITGFVVAVISILWVAHIQSEIYDMSKEVCKKIPKTEKYTYEFDGCKEYPSSSEIICEDGFTISEYELIDTKLICPTEEIMDLWFKGVKRSCLIKSTKEVCWVMGLG